MKTLQNSNAYRSPVRLLQNAGEYNGMYSEENIVRSIEKSRTYTSPIVADGILYSHSEALESLQNVNEVNWQHHVIIFQQKGLLRFLEQDQFDATEMEKARQFRFKPDFVRFISPWFARSFHVVSGAMIKKNDLDGLRHLLEFSGFVHTGEENLAFSAVLNFVNGIVSEARHVEAAGIFPDEEQISRLLSGNLITVFNRLPALATAIREEYLQILISIFKKSIKKVSGGPWLEGWAAVKKIQGSDIQEIEKEAIDRNVPSEKIKRRGSVFNENTALWAVGIFCVVGILFIYAMLHKKKPEPEDVIISGTFGGREVENVPSVEDQLSSSTNETSIRFFLGQMCKRKFYGKERRIATGSTPFEDFSILPPSKANCSVTVSNKSSRDAVMLYFSSNNTLINEQSRMYAAFIRRGESFTFSFDANFGRLNFLFGEKWIQLEVPVSIPVYNKEGNDFSAEEGGGTISGTWKVNGFFKYPEESTFYLAHNLTIQNFEQTQTTSNHAPVSKLLNEPEDTDPYFREEKHVSLVLSTGKNITASGNLYVYQSP